MRANLPMLCTFVKEICILTREYLGCISKKKNVENPVLLSLFSENLVATSSCKVRTLFPKDICFPGRHGRNIRDKAGKERRKPFLLFVGDQNSCVAQVGSHLGELSLDSSCLFQKPKSACDIHSRQHHKANTAT